jgi:tetratricopeptide (TPR) repeat protein
VLGEQQIYAKALSLYSNAFHLEPGNFTYAADLAQTYYSLKPLPVEPALTAWTNALRIASTPLDQEQVLVHLARVLMLSGRFTEARRHLNAVTLTNLAQPKANLLRAIEAREGPGTSTNSTPPPGRSGSAPPGSSPPASAETH